MSAQSGGTPPEVPPSLMVGTCYYGVDDGKFSAQAIGGGSCFEVPPADEHRDTPSEWADRMARYLVQTIRDEEHG